MKGWKIEKRSYSKSRYCIGRKGLSNVTIATEKEERENGGRVIFKCIF